MGTSPACATTGRPATPEHTPATCGPQPAHCSPPRSSPRPTTDGWQQVALANPVPVTAGTTYVASQHSSSGTYSLTGQRSRDGLPTLRSLHWRTAPRTGLPLRNGGFPTQSFSATNYWVDVVFDLDAVDDAAPTVTATTPASDATNVAVGSNVVARFSEPVDPATVTAGFVLRDGAGTPIDATGHVRRGHPHRHAESERRPGVLVGLRGHDLRGPPTWPATNWPPRSPGPSPPGPSRHRRRRRPTKARAARSW